MPITNHFSPDIFTLVPMSDLSREHFESHPIWSEHYDYDEREEIVEWGVDPEWLASEIDRVHTGNDHVAYPILWPYPLPQRMRLYIRSIFTLKNGRSYLGYVVNEDAEFCGIFVGEDHFRFGRSGFVRDFNEEQLNRMAATIDAPPCDVFPADYRTEFLDSNGLLIEGVFSLAANSE